MTKDLVKVLREKADGIRSALGETWGDWLCKEAADRIEELEAELKRKNNMLADIADEYQYRPGFD